MPENMKSEIVISGMSGRFPDSDTVEEFYEKLINKVDMISENDERYEPGTLGTPKRFGKINGLSKFDKGVFGFNTKESQMLDPQTRIALEVTYEAIVDAGYDPRELRGRKIGVFMGNCFEDPFHLACTDIDIEKCNGLEILERRKIMLANRISYAFDFKGPTINFDVACASSGMALHQAFQAMREDDCEAAIVVGANLILRPLVSVGFKLLKMISMDGRSKTFDKSVNGYARSDAIATVFLQRYVDARRNYASIVHMKTNNDGYKVEGITYPSWKLQKRLLSQVWKECGLDPRKISYLEAHATGTVAGDTTEMAAVDDVFCRGREKPLLVGSVKSNIGHSEATSALCQTVKLLLSMQKGVLPPNIHYNEPHPEIKALIDGRAKVVTEPTPWDGPYTAFNCYGFGGSNVHCILKSNSIVSRSGSKKNNFPSQLLLYCGRTRESVQFVFDSTTVKEAPREFFTLLHKSSYTSPKIKPYRGYKLLGVKGEVQDIKLIQHDEKQLWYVFSGMCAEWPVVAEDLMQIEAFAKSIQNSAEILKPFGFDLIEIVTNKSKYDTAKDCKTNKRKIITSIVYITAMQVAFVDVLNNLDLKPDGIIGHNVGELGCAYADGCLTAEQTLLTSWWLAKAFAESDLIDDDITTLRTPRKDFQKGSSKLACGFDNSSETISESTEKVKYFQAHTKCVNGFDPNANACNTTDNCEEVLKGTEELEILLEKVIPEPKLRSSRWITSSFPEDKWNSSETKVASALYFARNLMSPMFFEEALQHIPKNAIVVEIGPQVLHNIFWKKNIDPDSSYVSLLKKNGNNLVNLLSSIGKLYISGFDPDVEKFYPPVAFPVPRNTPVISPLIKWDHSETWHIQKWSKHSFVPVVFCSVNPGPVHSPDRYLLGHCIDGRFLFPATGYIYLVWTASEKGSFGAEIQVPVVFENVKFVRATLLSETSETKFTVHISKRSGSFEILESGMLVCSGRISHLTKKDPKLTTSDLDVDKKSLTLNAKDIYKEFRLRGYEYGPAFQGIMAANLSGTEGILKWKGDWIPYLDTLIQIPLISVNKRALLIPTGIEKLTLDPLEHTKLAEKALKKYEGIPVRYDDETKELFSAGVYVKNVSVGYQKKKPSNQFPLLEQYKFVPYEINSSFVTQTTLYKEYISVCLSVSRRILELYGKSNDRIKDNMDALKISDDLINKYLNSDENCYALLKCLSGILKSPDDKTLDQNIKECVRNYLNKIEDDILSQILLNESTLKTLLEIIQENVASRKIKVIEITEGSRTLSSMIHESVPIPSSLKMSYSVVHCNTELLCKDHLPPNADIIAWESKPSLEFKDVDVFVLNYLKNSLSDIRTILENAAACLEDDGFIIFLTKTKLIPAEEVLCSVSEILIPSIEECDLEQLFKEINLNVVCKIFDTFTSNLYLLRKSKTLSVKDSIVHVTAHDYDKWVDDLKGQMKKFRDSLCSERIWLVSEGSRHSGIMGLVNCLRLEPGGSNIRCVFTGKETSEIPKFSLSNSFYRTQLEKDLVMNVLQDGSWGSYRHILHKEDTSTIRTEHACLNILKIGDLSSLAWIPLPMKNITLTDNDVVCHVYYSSLNFKDVMLATGRLPLSTSSDADPQASPIGFEFSGRTSDGRRVMGIAARNAMATTVVVNRNLLWDVPDEWSLEEAATVPVVYATAYYALISRGKLKKGERVLIHSGSGGVGQAALTVALSMGCDVYTTVGSEQKKEFLMSKFPKLQEKHIFNSRDTTFEREILHATKGEGVDVVLNSLVGDKLFASLNCLADDGRFLEIGKYDLVNNSNLGMDIFLKNVSFHGIYLDILLQNQLVLEICQILKNGIAEGVVKPLNVTVFNHDQAEQAFRYMSTGKHIGKVLLKIREDEKEKRAIPSPASVNAVLRTTFDCLKSYIIIGGLGGVGLELCQWLIDRGAKNIILTSRSGVSTGHQKQCLQRWKQDSVNVVISRLNAARLDEARNLIMLAASLGPVSGIFNLALVLKDAFMENQTVQNYIDVCECKVETTKNLDFLTRELSPNLDWFVCFSSFAGGRGNPGQSNYGYANSVMERICEDRVKEGLSGLAVQWGPVGDVGVVEETMGSDIVMSGVVPQRISSCLAVLDTFLQQNHPVVSSVVLHQPDDADKKLNKEDLLFYIANIFAIKDVSSINPESTLSELGMDSLMAVELKQIMELNFDTVLSISDLQKLKVKELEAVTGKENTKGLENTSKIQSDDIGLFFGKFKALISKELIPSATVISMNTITDGLPLFLIHPIEGSVAMLKTLAEFLPCPVYGIQSTIDAPRDSLESLASWYWKHLKSLNIPTQYINLAGYSFGAAVAFEMALQAEQVPKQYPVIKNLIFLDGSHDFVTSTTRMLSSRFDEKMENPADQIVALSSFALMFTNDVLLDKKELFNLKSYPERIRYTGNKIVSAFPEFRLEDILIVFDMFSSKIKMTIKYNPKYKLKKEVFLIKASEKISAAKHLNDLYDLDEVCEGKITSASVEGDHQSFIEDNSAKEVANLLKDIFDKN